MFIQCNVRLHVASNFLGWRTPANRAGSSRIVEHINKQFNLFRDGFRLRKVIRTRIDALLCRLASRADDEFYAKGRNDRSFIVCANIEQTLRGFCYNDGIAGDNTVCLVGIK